MFNHRNLMTVCCAAVLAFGLAACGGGDDDDTAEAPTTMEPMEPTGPTQAELDAEKMRADEAEQALADAAAKEARATAAALWRSIRRTPLTNLRADTVSTPNVARVALAPTGVTVGLPDAAPATTATASPRMAPGDSVGSLGSWAGTNYMHQHPLTGILNQAVVYNNRGDGSGKPFAEGATLGGNPLNAQSGGNYDRTTRTVTLGTIEDNKDVKSGDFPTAGMTEYTADAVGGTVVLAGTYQGAMGNYRCSTETCTALKTSMGITLGGTWFFVHDVGAETSVADANYLYFGWWLQKDRAGTPRSASAFTGVVGSIAGDGTTALAINPGAATMSGSATYAGHAAGKFAINDPLGSADAGHFTADASFKATFGPAASAGLSGTIDNFMANDEAVDWTVTLFRAGWDTTTAGLTVPADDPATSPLDESMAATLWSVDGKTLLASGSWNAQMYDEKASGPADDGSNVPTSLTGTFDSNYSTTHALVGAFGATKE